MWKKEWLMAIQKTAYNRLQKTTHKTMFDFYQKVFNKATFLLKKYYDFENQNYELIMWDDLPHISYATMSRFLEGRLPQRFTITNGNGV